TPWSSTSINVIRPTYNAKQQSPAVAARRLPAAWRGVTIALMVGMLLTTPRARGEGPFGPPAPPRVAVPQAALPTAAQQAPADAPGPAASVPTGDGSLRTAWDCNTHTGFQPSVLRFGMLPPPPLASGLMGPHGYDVE